jgi:hypothetical protein
MRQRTPPFEPRRRGDGRNTAAIVAAHRGKNHTHTAEAAAMLIAK